MPPSPAQALHGRWRPEGAEPGSGAPFTEVELRADGKLRFSVVQAGADAVTELEYQVEDGVIVARGREANGGAETRTRFQLQPDGSLLLEYGGHTGRYVRA